MPDNFSNMQESSDDIEDMREQNLTVESEATSSRNITWAEAVGPFLKTPSRKNIEIRKKEEDRILTITTDQERIQTAQMMNAIPM